MADFKKDAQKAAFEAAYKAALSGKPLSQGTVNKIYSEELEKGAQAETPAANSPVPDGRILLANSSPTNPLVNTSKQPADNRTTQQKYDDAKKAYEAYTSTAEYERDRRNAQKKQLDFVGKAKELRATMDYYQQQLDAEANQRVTDANLKELEGWSEEDRRNLEEYIEKRSEANRSALSHASGAFYGSYLKNPVVDKYGIETVERMRETLEWQQNEKLAQEVAATAAKHANERPWLGGAAASTASVPANLVGAVSSPIGYLSEMLSRTGQYSTLDPNNASNIPSVYAETVRSEVAENIRGDEESTNWLRKLAALGYQGGMNAADSAARTLASGGIAGVSAAIAASGAFSNGLRQYSQQGASPEQAAAMALTSAGLEYITEKITTENVLKMFKSGNKTGAAREIIKQVFFVEPTSEEVNLFAGVAAEAAILGEKSSTKQQIGEAIANGMSYQEAQMQVWKGLWQEAIQTYFVSMFSGLISSTGANVLGKVVNGGQQMVDATAAELAQNAPVQQKQPLTEGQQHMENGVASTLDDILSTNNISNNVADKILSNPAAVEELKNLTGMELGNTKAENRKAVKAALNQLMNQQTSAKTEVAAEVETAPELEVAPSPEQAQEIAPAQTHTAEEAVLQDIVNVKGTGAAEQETQTEATGDHAVGAMESQFKHEVKDSKVYENTYKNATNEEIRKVGEQAKVEDPNIGKYDAITEAESLRGAELRTETAEGRAAEYDYLMQKDGWSGEDNDTATILLKNFRQEENTEAFINLAKKQRAQGTQAGQMIQSFAKYSREDATVAVQDAIEDIENLTEKDVANRFLKNESDFDTWKKEVSKDMLGIANDIENVKAGDKAGMLDVVRQLANYRRTTAWAGASNELTRRTEKGLSKMDFATLKTVAKTQLSMIPSDFRKRSTGEIVNALRYQNMLFSVTTMLKNHSGNISNGIMDSVSDSSVGQFADFVISKFTGKRTVGSDVKYAPEYIKAARDAADVAAAFVSLDIPMDDGAKYVKGNTRTWSPNSNLFGRMLSAYEKHLRYSLEVSDKFYEGGAEHTVKKSLERLGEKSGLTKKQIDSLAESAALRRTFKDPGFSIGKDGKPQKGRSFARASVGMQKALNNIGTGDFGAGDVLMPFAAVSAEVKQVGMDYTGAGLVSGLKEMISIAKDAKAGKTIDPYRQRSAATTFGRGVTGVVLTAAFAAIAAAGAIKVHSSRKQEEKIMEQTQGLSGAQWNLNAALRYVEAVMNGKTFEEAKAYASWQDGDVLTSIDFLEPFNTQMHIGYLLSQDTDILTAIARGNFEALLEMPMMQTLSDAADLLQAFTEVSEGDLSGVWDATGQLVGTIAGSAVPNWMRQTAKVIDPNYRDTYDTDPIQKAIKEVIAGVPFASKQLPEKYDTLGKEQKRYENGETLKAAIETMVTPWDTKKYDTNAVYQEIERLNAIDGINVTPPRMARKLTYTDKNGVKHENYNLTAEEYETFQRVEGQTAERIIYDFTKNADYAKLTDAQKDKAFDFVYAYAKEQGRVDAIADYKGYSDAWMQNISGKEARAIINKVVSADIKGAMDAMSNAWSNDFDDAESRDALETAYEVYSNLGQGARKTVKEDATGRTAAFLEAKNNRVSTETFVDLYKTYWELDKSSKKATEKANEWAYTLERAQESGKLTEKQKGVMKEALGFSQYIPAEAAKFDELTGSELSAKSAQAVVDAITGLEPEAGHKEVRDIQKLDAIIQMTLSDMEKESAMRVYMTDKQEEKLDEVLGMGFDVDDYPELYRIADAYTSGTGKKARTIKYLQKEYGIEYAAAKKLYEVFK